MIFTPNLKKAIRFATKTHEVYQKQKRKGKDIPYITHPLAVGLILSQAGADEDVMIAGILHDTIEDSVPEKKVSREMIAERFGERVAAIVVSVSEMRKDLLWEKRKEEALKHIETFNEDSLLVKSADVISNMSELLYDFSKDGNATFSRFNAPKDKLLLHALSVIKTLLEKWPESPLAGDLTEVRDELLKISEPEFYMLAHPATIIEYQDYDENLSLTCPVCAWKGTPKENGWIEYHDDLFDVSCPKCEKMLLVVSYPLVK